MNFGTKIRTALLIIALLNQANASIGALEFGNTTVDLIYKVFSYLLTLGAAVASWWFNNDYTPIASEYTGAMRQEKARLKGEMDGLDIVVEDFLDDEDDYLEDGDDHIEGDENE